MASGFPPASISSSSRPSCGPTPSGADSSLVMGSGPRLLLGDAVDAAAAGQNVERRHLHDAAVGEGLGDDVAGGRVVGVIERRHDDAAVGDVVVHVGQREALASEIARFARQRPPNRSEESLVGKAGVSMCRYRWSRYN